MLVPETLPAQTPQPTFQPASPGQSDWDRLSMLDPSSTITVTAAGHRPFHCRDLSVDNDGLSCSLVGMRFPPRYLDFPRMDVEQVQLRHDRRNFWIGVGAASAAGFALGSWQHNTNDPQARVGYGLAGAALGGLVSIPFAAVVAHFIPGNTIYRRPARKPLLPRNTQ